MRRLTLLLALVLLVPALAGAQSIGGSFIQYVPPAGGSGTWDGGAFTDPATGPSGCTNPAYSFTADTNAGLCLGAANDLTIQTATSGNSRSYVRLTTSVLSNYFVDAGGNVTGWDLGDEAVLSVNSSQLLRFGDTLGSGFLVGKGGATAAVVRSIAAGTGISVSNGDGQSGNPTMSVDTATTPQKSSGTGLPPAASCDEAAEVGNIYSETDVPRSCVCSAVGTWVCSAQTRTHATDCTALTDGLTNDLCWELDSERAFLCQPTAGGCDTAGEWIAQTVSAAQISSGDVAFSQIAQASGASVLVGRGSAGGAGDFQEITLGSGLSMSGTELSASASSFDPSTSVDLYEEFLGGTGTSGAIGHTGMGFYAQASGTAAYTASLDEHPGLARLNSHVTNDDSGVLVSWPDLNAGSQANFGTLGANDWTVDGVVLPGSNSTTIANVAIFFGLQPDYQASGGIFIRYDTDRSDATWIFVVCNASGAAGCQSAGDNTNIKVVASSVTPVAGTWNRLRIRRLASGVGGNPTLYFRVNDETEKTFCLSGCDDTLGTVPTSGNAAIGFEYLTRTTTGVKSGDFDYLRFTMSGLTRY